MELVITNTAKADLKNIYLHIKKENPMAAKEFVSDLSNKLFSLAENGVTGSPRDWISRGLRAFPYRDRCFYFRIINKQMIVVRVLHGAQDVVASAFHDGNRYS